MRILVTGHRGFVGKYFLRKYADHEIVGIDIKEGNDCRDFFKVSDDKFDLVIHLAAIVGGRQTIDNNPLSVATDLSIDSEMCQWALRTKPSRIIYFSSSAAYPTKLQKNKYQLKEDDIDLSDVSNPDMTYGWAKLTGEYLLQFLNAEGIKTNVFRPFSGYGTDQDLDYPFPSYIKRANELANPFDIWGDGNQVRDFIHMHDIIDAVDIAINEDIQGPVNLGSGVATSFNELFSLVTELKGYEAEPNHIIGAPVGVQYRVCDPSKMLSFYTPKISLEEGILRALRGEV
jgi:nucleoside-diphosphate-sugar epimerase